MINPFTGYVDILLYPNGTVVPTTIYSTPSSFGMSGAFFHFWLAERSDVVAMQLDRTAIRATGDQPAVILPVGNISQQLVSSSNPYTGPRCKGEYRIVTLFTRTGQITSNDNVAVRQSAEPGQRDHVQPGLPVPGDRAGNERRAMK